MQSVDLFRGKGQLRNDVGIFGIAVERVGFCGDVETVFLPEPVEVVFHVQTVHALGRAVDVIVLTPVVAVHPPWPGPGG